MNANPATVPTFLIACSWFAAGAHFYKRYPRAAMIAGALLAVPCGLAVFYYTHLLDNAVWYYEARTARGTELLFSGVGLLAGAVHCWNAAEGLMGRLAIPALFATILLIPFIKPILQPLDTVALKDECAGNVCRQSSYATCGPASAASILRSLGKNVTEKELAEQSYTYSGGTEVWYLARAIRNRGVGTEFVFSNGRLPAPSIAGVRMGGGHFIAIMNATNSSITVVDPLIGQVNATPDKLRETYHFTGFFLCVRPEAR